MTHCWHYDFPPFFTIQPNDDTRRVQLDAWCDVILGHCAEKKMYTLNISEVIKHPPFVNDKIDRRLSPADLVAILKDMEKKGRIEWIRAGDRSKDRKSGNKDSAASDEPTTCLVYWLKPDEWAQLVTKWVDAKGIQGTMCTLYEIINDEVTGGELFGLDERILLKALQVLQAQQKAVLVKTDNTYGVKFL